MPDEAEMTEEAPAATTEEPDTAEDSSPDPDDGAKASGDPEFVDPESPARAEAGRSPRGAPPM